MVRCCLTLLLGVFVAGCSGSGATVSGVVYLNDKPLPDAYVTFFPEGNTAGLGGNGRTNAEGKYTIVPSRDGALAPGTYRVIVRRPLNPDGTPGDPNLPEMDSPAKESLPPEYSQRDLSTLHVEVGPEKLVHDLKLVVAPQ